MNTSGYLSPPSMGTETDFRGKTFIIPDKCFEKRIACSWRHGNKFAVYPRSQTVSKTPEEEIPENKIVNIRQEVSLFAPILRKLVNESNGTFLCLQKVAETSKNSDNHVEFLKLSRQYRSIIRVCIESLQEASEKETDSHAKNNLLSYVTIFYSIECIWHLCEILYIDKIPGDIVLPYLLEWIRFHFPCHEQTAAQILEACERGSEEHTEYWDTVIGMIVQGRVDVARALLKLHSDTDTNEFKLLDNSLRSMPVYSIYGGISTAEFTVTWKHWQSECRAKLASRVFSSNPQLELIMRLITGEYAAFESIISKYKSWLEVVGGWVLYTAPWSRRRSLNAPAAACAGLAPPRHSKLDFILRALMEDDLYQVIHEIQQFGDNGWFATHLTDILYHTGNLKILDKHQADVTSKLRDSLVLEYGTLLCEHKSLWAVGVSYCCGGGAEGSRRAAVLLERVPPTTSHKALRIHAEATKHRLSQVAQTVSASMSAGSLGYGRIGAALGWAVRARSPRLAARAAHTALTQYCTTGHLPAADLLLTAGPAVVMADTLVFLGKYCDFHKLYKNREFKKAAQLLVSLIKSKIAPEYFWETLLLDCLPLLESDEPVFTSDDTYDIIIWLETGPKSLSGERAELLRLALARNLARTVCASSSNLETQVDKK